MKRVMFMFFAGILTISIIPAVLNSEETSSEELLFMEIPSVITASKREEPVNKAPSVVYVVTEDEIKRSGSRSLAEILKRVPGMHISIRESSLLGSRGFTSDQNDKFVFLIDGTPITSIMQDGPWGFIDMPNLDMVKRVEIVKGPGSTLWGSDASFGIINIITKNGEDIGGVRPSLSFSSNDEQSVGNVLYGNKTENKSYMFSFTYTNSKGYSNTPNEYNHVYSWGSNDTPNPYYGAGNNSKGNRLLDFQPSWEFYGKISYADGFSLKSRASYERMGYLWGTDYDAAHQDIFFKHFFTDLEKQSDIGDNTAIINKLNFHTLSYDRGVLTQGIDPTISKDLETKTEMGVTAESFLNTVVSDIHRITAGIKVQSVQFGPSTRQNYMVVSGSTTLNGGYPVGYKYVYVTDANLDNTYGIYVEDSCDVSSKFTVVGGLSYEYNDLREVGGIVMPRAAVIYSITDAFSAKYTYNTGYQRPPVDKKFHKMFGHVEKSETIDEHDVQFAYSTNRTHASVTAYSYLVYNYFTWVDRTTTDGYQGHANQGDAKSVGIETELKHNFSNAFQGYLSFMNAETKINNATPVGDPKSVYNVGVDYSFKKDLTMNLNINGWMDMLNGGPNNSSWSGDTDHILDVSFVADNVANRPMTLTLFVKNLLNNTKSHIGMTGWPGYTYLESASVGIKMSYKL